MGTEMGVSFVVYPTQSMEDCVLPIGSGRVSALTLHGILYYCLPITAKFYDDMAQPL